MTTHYAASNRARLRELNFGFDTVLCEEAGQVTELELLVALSAQHRGGRLERLVLLGDLGQLPPLASHPFVRDTSGFTLPLMARLLRLGHHSIRLTELPLPLYRPSILNLWAWRYPTLDISSACASTGGTDGAVAGMRHSHQLVHVGDLQAQGQTSPHAHAYENLAEAEYVVSTFQYLRLLGHPTESIALVAAYGAQRSLIERLASERCAHAPQVFGKPFVTTIDAFASGTVDIVLLSLVRTDAPGFLADPRRLTAAFSRARRGLYVFARRSMLEKCHAFHTGFSALVEVEPSTQLQLVVGEGHPTSRMCATGGNGLNIFAAADVVSMGAVVQQMQGL